MSSDSCPAVLDVFVVCDFSMYTGTSVFFFSDKIIYINLRFCNLKSNIGSLYENCAGFIFYFYSFC